MIGKTVSHYKIIRELGAGGMGVVYEAEDVRLNRIVAVKFLHDQPWLGDAERTRFLNEAKSAASLSHDAICTVFSIDEFEGRAFIVMEYVEGACLKRMVEEGFLPIKKSLRLAAQIADGLQAAHDSGIVHRDIKSANIIVSKNGRAKMLDFGLARMSGTTRVTATGTAMGTIAYMSPEQSRGEEVDHRTDVWSLGVVLYEMVTGHLPFTGDSDPAAIYAIANLEPEPLRSFRANLPNDLAAVVAKALDKNPDARYQHADEMGVDLHRILNDQSSSSVTTGIQMGTAKRKSGVPKSALRVGLLLIPLAVLLVALGGFLNKWTQASDPELPSVLQFTVPLGEGHVFADEYAQDLAISRDGTQMAFVGVWGGNRMLMVHSLASNSTLVLPESEGAAFPFFSPDGDWVGFFSGEKLKKANIEDLDVLTVCRAPSGLGGSWRRNGSIILAMGEGDRLFQVSERGGTPEQVPGSRDSTRLGRYWWPESLPGERGTLVTRWTGFGYEDPLIMFIHPDRREPTILAEGGFRPRYLDTGHVLYLAGTSLMAIPFDAATGSATGQAFMVEQDCGVTFALSDNWTFVNLHGGGSPQVFEQERTLVWVDRKGNTEKVGVDPGPYVFPVLSPEGSRLGVTFFLEEGLENRILHLDQGVFTRLTQRSFDHVTVWSPCGTLVAFSSNVDVAPNIFIRPSDGTGAPHRLTTSDHHQDPSSWAPDGKVLAMVEFPAGQGDIYLIEMTGDSSSVRPYLVTPFDERHPMISPDGAWMVFTSNQTGRREIYLASMKDAQQQVRLSTHGGSDPLWSPLGDEVFYWAPTGGELIPARWTQMTSVMVDPEDGRPVGSPQALFDKDWVHHSAGRPNYDVAPGGSRFLMLEPDWSPPTDFWVTLNWKTRFGKFHR